MSLMRDALFRSAFVSFSALSLVSAGAAQSADGSHAPAPAVFKIDARLVVLDVAVTDKSGQPVDGLTAKDFKVFEDDRPQAIRSFEQPAAHTLPSASAGANAAFDPAQPTSFGSSAVTVLVFDQLNTHFADSSFARRSLHDYLAGQPPLLPQPTALLGVSDSRFRQLQGFTRDRDALLRALASAHIEYPWRLEIDGKTEFGPVERLDASLRALEQIAESFGQIPGRKNLIWVGGGFPTVNPTTIDGDDALAVKNALQRVTDLMLNTHTALYAVDPSSTAAGMTEITDSSQMEFVQTAGDAVSGDIDPFGASDDFNRLGPVTGGRVLRARNDIAQAIAASVEMGAHFYTLSYAPNSASEAAAKFRKIRVVCLRPGLTVTTRTGYYPGEIERTQSKASAIYDLTTAAQTDIALNAVHIAAEPNPAAAAELHEYIVRAAASTLSWEPKQDGTATASVYILAVALDAKNKVLAYAVHGMTANALASANLNDPAKTANFAFTAPRLDKAATLRFVVRDNASGRMGSYDIPLKAR